MLAQSNHKNRFLSRLFRLLMGEWPSLRMGRRGYRFEIENKYGRLIVHAKGPYALQWAWDELQQKSDAPPTWQEKIALMNQRCEEAKRRFQRAR